MYCAAVFCTTTLFYLFSTAGDTFSRKGEMGRGRINPSGNASIPNSPDSPRGKQQKSGFNVVFTQFPSPHALELKQLQDPGSLPAATASPMRASTGFRSAECPGWPQPSALLTPGEGQDKWVRMPLFAPSGR